MSVELVETFKAISEAGLSLILAGYFIVSTQQNSLAIKAAQESFIELNNTIKELITAVKSDLKAVHDKIDKVERDVDILVGRR